MNTQTENTSQFELGIIDSISTLVDRVAAGDFSGRLYSKLIDGDPINSALNCIKEFHVANNSVMGESVLKKIQNEETRLVEVLLAKKEEPEVQKVIESLKKANKYGVSTIEKINNAEKINKPLNVVSDSSFPILDLPNDVLKIILVTGDVDDMGKFFKVSKKTNQLANDETLWKSFCIKEGEADKGKYTTWKDFYLEEVYAIASCRGKTKVPFCYDRNRYNVYINTEKINLNRLKKLIKINLNLNCEISKMELINNDKRLKDPLNIESSLFVGDIAKSSLFDLKVKNSASPDEDDEGRSCCKSFCLIT